jgi:hypothetical protein
MKSLHLTAALIVNLAAVLTASGGELPPLDTHLEPLRPLLEKTWKGEFKDSKPDKPTIDISRWERALNGRAVRVLHSINDGIYGGEMLMMWDQSKQQIGYHYFTTAGFTSTGTMEVQNGKFITHEVVHGDSQGVTEVRSVAEITPEGTLHVRAEHLKNGTWTPGHEVTYRPDPSAKVVFR